MIRVPKEFPATRRIHAVKTRLGANHRRVTMRAAASMPSQPEISRSSANTPSGEVSAKWKAPKLPPKSPSPMSAAVSLAAGPLRVSPAPACWRSVDGLTEVSSARGPFIVTLSLSRTSGLRSLSIGAHSMPGVNSRQGLLPHQADEGRDAEGGDDHA